MKNPERKSVFQLKKETWTRSQQKKIGDISSSEDEDFPTSTKKRKRRIEIGDDLD